MSQATQAQASILSLFNKQAKPKVIQAQLDMARKQAFVRLVNRIFMHF